MDIEALIEDFAQEATDQVEIDDLMDYYKEGQIAFLEDLSEEELIEHIKSTTIDFDFSVYEE